MKYRIYSLLLLLILVSVIACAQEKYGIKNVQLFSRVQMPGNIPVNERGEPLMGPVTVYTVVVETTGKPVQWTTAYTKNKAYSITATPVSNLPYDAGTDDATEKQILLTPAKGNQLWLLELTPTEAGATQRNSVDSGSIMLLRGKTGNKTFSRPIHQQTTIRTLPVY